MMDDNCDDGEKRATLLRAEPIPGTPHILITEQQPVLQEMLCWMLQLAGYRATVCADADQDVPLLWREQTTSPGDNPLILLLDLGLLCATEAADLLSQLRARWHESGKMTPRVILLTTNTQVQTAMGQRECVLQKPFHIRDLLALIQRVTSAARLQDGLSRDEHT